MNEEKRPGGPDLTQGVLPADFTEGKLLGHVADDEVLLVQVGNPDREPDAVGHAKGARHESRRK